MERKRLTVPTEYLSRPDRRGIHSVIAPYIFIRTRMTEMEEALLDQSQTMMCGTFTALRTSRPPPIPLRHISSYMSMSYDFSQELLRTAEAMMDYTKSSDMELYFIDALRNEIYRCPRTQRENSYLVRDKIGPGTTLPAYVAYTKNYVFVNDVINDENYPKGLDRKESIAQRIICIPVLTPSKELVAVLQLSRNVNTKPYSTSYSAKVINAQCSIFYMVSDTGNLYNTSDNINYDMYMHLEKYFHCKKTSFGHNIKTVASETRRRNKMLNLGKEELYPNFDLDIYKPVVVTSSMAATTKGYAADRGVAEMVNKQDDVKFCAEDELIFSNILQHADYVLSFHKLTEEIKKLEACLATRNETLLLLFEPCRHDKSDYAHLEVEIDPELYSIDYTPNTECHLTLCKIIEMMFLDIVYRWTLVEPEERARFLLTVQKVSTGSGNWDFMKIFCAVHCVATIIKRCPQIFTELEKELLMYSALCYQVNIPVFDQGYDYDLDAFPEKPDCDYSFSFYYTKLIFKNCKIFSDEEETVLMLSKMRKLMEACHHSRIEGKVEKIVMLLANKNFNMEKPKHRHLLRVSVMVVAGFAMHFKPFSFSVEYQIKKTLGSKKSCNEECCGSSEKFQNMDRVELATSQRSFLDTVVLPWAIILKTLLPQTTLMIFKLVEERENWNEITKSNICKDFWIPLKIEPTSERNIDIINFLESVPKACQEKETSSADVIGKEDSQNSNEDQEKVEQGDDESSSSGTVSD
ncbi:cAMP and cAMP-inhibited cGMP 3',5'-cyclic phosphodiesterase 10A [Halyomorpha halys]|uniref:cAMP and cAMP-inhibited cGMP 3',5'-cyclic phosphodiesterase 10A n=1 Tax=Halyomorpha halys TaxID=286706 RepID=UPI0006D52936